ncbi:MAG: polysaccharide biosynthesis tyrosine autokinase [Cyanobacteria bacterium J069]
MDQELDLQTSAMDDIGEATAPKKGGLPIGGLIRMVKRKVLLIGGMTGVLSVAAWLSTASDLPTYRGNFQLLVEPVTSEARIAEPTALTRSAGGVPSRDIFSLDYPTQLQILRSPKVLEEVYKEVQAKYPAFSYIELIQGLELGRVGNTRTTETKILQVVYQGSDAGLVQLVLDELASKYLRYSLEDRKSRISEGVKFIEDQLPGLQKRVDELEGQLQELQQTYELIDPSSQGGQIFSQLQTVTEQQVTTQQQIQEQRVLYNTLQRQLGLSPNEAIAASALSQDPRYQQILSSINEIDSQIALESSRFTDESPIIQRLRQRQANLSNLLGQQANRILGPQLARKSDALTYQDSLRLDLIKQLINTTNEMQVLQMREQFLSGRQADVSRQMQQFPTIARRYAEIQRQLGIATRTLDQLLGQRETLRVEAAQTQVPWELISAPMLPRNVDGIAIPDPNSSRKKLMMGMVAGLALGVGTSILIEKRQDIFFSAEDVKDAVPAPLLGALPACATADPCGSLLDIAPSAGELSEEAFPFLDAVNNLYASLRFLNPHNLVRSLVICSPSAGDGKTTTALHLAETAAAAGQRVLLVDANLRTPNLHAILNLPNECGLSELLAQKVYPEDAIQVCPSLEHLCILTAGQTPPGTTKMLASPQMKDLMAAFDAQFDLIIYDTPNLSSAVDANFLAAQADGILLVLAVRQTAYSKTKNVLKKLAEFHLPIIGTVANRAIAPAEVSEDGEEYDEDSEGIWDTAAAELEPDYNPAYNSDVDEIDEDEPDDDPQPALNPLFVDDIAS